MSLDSIDRAIIRQLRLNGRLPNTALARAVGLSASACLRRVEILERTGVIKGYTAIIGGLLDDGIVAIVRITLERQTEEYLNRFEAAVRRHPEIEECFLMTGDVDYVLRARAANAAAYEQIHKDILSRLPGVSRIHSSIAMRSVMAAF
ncbi:Lrp/AsnC family transcriptional regulator [Sphingobium aquiterrae]|uniref:Lrp/AsnC family transcriptional regulator n=1 Tax=Sphingobium aquiterrae TaxID=2038656 RepID=UPI0030171E34